MSLTSPIDRSDANDTREYMPGPVNAIRVVSGVLKGVLFVDMRQEPGRTKWASGSVKCAVVAGYPQC